MARRPMRGICAALALLLVGASPIAAGTAEPPGDPALAQLGFIESLYREGDRFRAESEMLRFLHDAPADPRRDAVELARAKLYFQERRYGEARLMLHSLLDRFPSGASAREGERLLAYAELMEGRPAEAAAALRRAGAEETSLSGLATPAGPPPGEVDPDQAVAWSTALPGAGFFLLGEPAKATVALTLNLAFLAGAAIAYQQQNFGAALALLLVEIALYSGGREAVRREAETRLAAQQQARREAWLEREGAAGLLAVGIRIDFGGN